jgi:hypothetical protein
MLRSPDRLIYTIVKREMGNGKSGLRNSEWEDCEAPKIVELGIRNFPNSAIRISSISPSPIPQSAIRNSFVGLSPALQRRRHPTNGYFCKGVRSAIVTVEYGDTGRFPASKRRAGVWTFQHLSRWRCRRIPRSKSHERGMSSGLTANSSARYCSASVRSNW